jgi:Flp pilus assembly protein TadD
LLLLPASGREPASAAGQSSTDRAAAKDDAFQRGLIALKEGRFEAALQELTAAESQHPSDAAVRNFRGIALAGLGRNAEAVSEYQVAIRMDPRMGDAYQSRRGKHSGSVYLFRKWIRAQ